MRTRRPASASRTCIRNSSYAPPFNGGTNRRFKHAQCVLSVLNRKKPLHPLVGESWLVTPQDFARRKRPNTGFGADNAYET